MRFEPGEEKEVELVDYGGARVVHGFHNLVNGETNNAALKTAMERLEEWNNQGV